MKYIHVIMMALALTLSMSVQAQKQKKEKEPKNEKVQKEKKQKESKQKESKKKDLLVSFANFKVAKKGTVEYNAQRQAAFQVMDSLLHHTRTSDESRKYFGRVYQENDLVRFADAICEKFDNDPVLMDSIAASFFGTYSNEFLGHKRFRAIKEMYPKYVDAYYTEMAMYHFLAWRNATNDSAKFDPVNLQKAKAQIDSAKLIVPNDPEPYWKWIQKQGKYSPESVFPEIDTLKMRIHNYPGYLKAARYFDAETKNDPNLVLSARDCYRKAERDSMIAQDFINYSTICYYIGSRQKKASDYEEGIQVATEGLGRFPNNYVILRQKLYNQGGQTNANGLTADEKSQMWPKLYEIAMEFAQIPDTFKRQYLDYKWIAKANMEMQHYEEAIDFYQKELAMEFSDSLERSSSMLSIVDCYNSMKEYISAVSAFADYEKYKARHNLEMDILDYLKIGRSFEKLASDTFISKDERFMYYQKVDSCYSIGGSISPLNIMLMTRLRFDNAWSFAQFLDDGSYGQNGFLVQPVLIEAADRLIKIAEAQLDSLKEQLSEDKISDNDYNSGVAQSYFRIQQGYRWLMEHCIVKENYVDAVVYSEMIRSLPDMYDLDGMTPDLYPQYEKFRKRADEVYSSLNKKYGKKKGRI